MTSKTKKGFAATYVAAKPNEGAVTVAMQERTIWMQDIHLTLTLAPEQVHERAEAYEQAYAGSETVALIDWGFSSKRQQGYIVLEWAGEIDPNFLVQVHGDAAIEDYCVYDVTGETRITPPGFGANPTRVRR